ncbi:MAG: RNA polymerase subunit sigma-24 [Alphaproteobacteria bacterium]|nr:RNA polymerase subunit sigma-24 [Alphaproteobacteria bacterium]
MLSRNRYDGVEGYAVTKIRFHARQLARTGLLPSQDAEDIEQELMLDLLRRLDDFDPGRASRNTFIARVVENAVATLIEAAKAEKRGSQFQHDSLDAPLGDDDQDSYSLGDITPDDVGLWAAHGLRWNEAADLRRDLSRVLDRLPHHLSSLCTRLSVGTVTEVSRDTGMPRPTIYDALTEVRRELLAAGFGSDA